MDMEEEIAKAAARTKAAAPAPKGGASILTDKEIADAKAKARANIEKKAKDAATKKLIEDEELRLQREEGLITGDPAKDEYVNITIDLPEFCDRVTVDGAEFFHGHTYKMPRHQANSIRETMSRTWAHQSEIEGKSLTQAYQARRLPVLSGAHQ